MDHKELLKAMLQDVINDRMEQAGVTMHDYFVAKTREVTGLGSKAQVEEDAVVEGRKPDDSVTEQSIRAEIEAASGKSLEEMGRAELKNAFADYSGQIGPDDVAPLVDLHAKVVAKRRQREQRS
jgi:hypothetical protein